MFQQKDTNLSNTYERDGEVQSRKILVAVGGSLASLRALSYANSLFTSHSRAKIFLMHVMEWSDEEDETVDEALVS
jgi:hypothetical protein